MSPALPPCGLFRTTTPIGEVPAGRLVYFHNHGDPGPGVYLPERWNLNRAIFHVHGQTLPEPVARLAASLEPLPDEGFYRVREPFFCCEKRCRTFEAELLVQLGYDGAGNAILFLPELTAQGISVPSTGSPIASTNLGRLAAVKVAERSGEVVPRGGELH